LKCGRCCYYKVIVDGRVVYTPYPCQYLDTKTNLCTIYKDRHTINPDCLTVEEGIRLEVFPADCPYVKDIKGYKGPIVNAVEGVLGSVVHEER
jgi:uncharacterized cysteine cluster protein YcgN (CxxCxxCC family)